MFNGQCKHGEEDDVNRQENLRDGILPRVRDGATLQHHTANENSLRSRLGPGDGKLLRGNIAVRGILAKLV